MLGQLVEALAQHQGPVIALDTFVASCEEQCKVAERLYSVEDKLVDAFVLVDSMERSFRAHADNLDEALEHASSVMSAYEGAFRQIRQRYGELQLLCHSYFRAEGWELAKNSNGVRTFYRHDDGEPTVSIKMIGTIAAPVLNIIALIYECDLWRTWFDRLTHSDTVRDVGRFAKTVYFRATAPGPVAARDGFVLGQGFDLLEVAPRQFAFHTFLIVGGTQRHGSIVILARDATPGELGRDAVPPAAANDVRLRLAVASCVLIPIGASSTEVIMVANADPRLPVIPYWLINWVTKIVASWVFEKMAQMAAALPDEYLERMKANPRVYDEVRKRLAQRVPNGK